MKGKKEKGRKRKGEKKERSHSQTPAIMVNNLNWLASSPAGWGFFMGTNSIALITSALMQRFLPQCVQLNNQP